MAFFKKLLNVAPFHFQSPCLQLAPWSGPGDQCSLSSFETLLTVIAGFINECLLKCLYQFTAALRTCQTTLETSKLQNLTNKVSPIVYMFPPAATLLDCASIVRVLCFFRISDLSCSSLLRIWHDFCCHICKLTHMSYPLCFIRRFSYQWEQDYATYLEKCVVPKLSMIDI